MFAKLDRKAVPAFQNQKLFLGQSKEIFPLIILDIVYSIKSFPSTK